MPLRGSRRVSKSSRKASCSHRGIARKPNYTLFLSLGPAAKRHGIRIKEMCLTVNNIWDTASFLQGLYLTQTYLISDSGQTDSHLGLFRLESLFFCHPEMESLRVYKVLSMTTYQSIHDSNVDVFAFPVPWWQSLETVLWNNIQSIYKILNFWLRH